MKTGTPWMPTENTSGNALLLRQRRARYRASHRGIREMDLILGPYADARTEGMDEAMITRFEALLDEMDADLLSWVTGQTPIPDTADKALIEDVTAHQLARNKQG